MSEKVTKIAKAEVGYLEKRSNKDLDSKTANAGSANYTKYGKWYGDNPDYWCAMFICWIFAKAYGDKKGKEILWGTYSAACETLRNAAVKAKAYTRAKPKAGYIVFFTGSRHYGANHIGYIYKVSGNTIYTIEGNTSGGSGVIDNGGGVAQKSYVYTNSRIMGFGIPNYPKEDAPKKESYTGDLPTLPPRGYYTIGDGYKQLTGYKTHIKRIQKFLNWAISSRLDADGEYGKNTAGAVEKFQGLVSIGKDGKFGPETLKKAKAFTK